jgi:hypothetical protein
MVRQLRKNSKSLTTHEFQLNQGKHFTKIRQGTIQQGPTEFDCHYCYLLNIWVYWNDKGFSYLKVWRSKKENGDIRGIE